MADNVVTLLKIKLLECIYTLENKIDFQSHTLNHALSPKLGKLKVGQKSCKLVPSGVRVDRMYLNCHFDICQRLHEHKMGVSWLHATFLT